MSYKTIKFISRNEHGDRQVEIVMEQSWWQKLFNVKVKKRIFVQEWPNRVWYNKDSGGYAGTDWDYICACAVESYQQASIEMLPRSPNGK